MFAGVDERRNSVVDGLGSLVMTSGTRQSTEILAHLQLPKLPLSTLRFHLGSLVDS